MTDVVQLISIVVSAALLATVIELVRRGLLTEEYSFIWIGSAGRAAAVIAVAKSARRRGLGARRSLSAGSPAPGPDVLRRDRVALFLGRGVPPSKGD